MNSTQITITGNLAEGAELGYSPAGKASARVRIAVNTRYRSSAGEWVDGATSWYTVIAWGRLAENLAASAGKGERVIVHGRLDQREYTTDAGERRTVWEVTAEDVGLSLRHTGARAERATASV